MRGALRRVVVLRIAMLTRWVMVLFFLPTAGLPSHESAPRYLGWEGVFTSKSALGSRGSGCRACGGGLG